MTDLRIFIFALALMYSVSIAFMWAAIGALRDRVEYLEKFKDLVVDLAEEHLNKSTTESE